MFDFKLAQEFIKQQTAAKLAFRSLAQIFGEFIKPNKKPLKPNENDKNSPEYLQDQIYKKIKQEELCLLLYS